MGRFYVKPYQVPEPDMSTEEWKDIKGYEGVYQISNKGRVRSRTRKINTRVYKGQIMMQKATYSPDGKAIKCDVFLRNKSRQMCVSVGKAVLEAFVGYPNGNCFKTRHIDGNNLNNSLENLQWWYGKEKFAQKNEKARALYVDKAYETVRKIVLSCFYIRRPWLYGYNDVDDLIQNALLDIWQVIDLYDDTHCTFYTFCRKKTEWAFHRIYTKSKRRNNSALMLSTDFSERQYANIER